MPQGERGTIYFEGGLEFEYHNDPDKTRSSRHPKGWTTLGDVGYLDADGFLFLTDRKAYMIISGGVNIYPQEAENVLITHPKVVDVAVFGVPNDEFGEEVKAVVQPVEMPVDDEEADALAAELIRFCRSQLADVKCPRSIDFRTELPRHPTGKLYKRLLKRRVLVGRRPQHLNAPARDASSGARERSDVVPSSASAKRQKARDRSPTLGPTGVRVGLERDAGEAVLGDDVAVGSARRARPSATSPSLVAGGATGHLDAVSCTCSCQDPPLRRASASARSSASSSAGGDPEVRAADDQVEHERAAAARRGRG